jgi:hypothetical protein
MTEEEWLNAPGHEVVRMVNLIGGSVSAPPEIKAASKRKLLLCHMVECAEKQRRRTPSSGPDCETPAFDPPAEGDPEPLQVLVNEEEAAQFRALISKAGEKEPLALKTLDCALAGFTKPYEMAELLETPVTEIYRVKKKLKGHFLAAQRKHRNQRPQS